MQAEHSLRIKVIRLFAMIGVIYTHSLIASSATAHNAIMQSAPSILSYFWYFFSGGIAKISVPLFSLISGFLFFRDQQLHRELYKKKVKSRFNSLVVPYFLWNGCYFLLLLALSIVPQAHHFFVADGSWVFKDSVWGNIVSIWGLDGGTPILYQFYFIRDLAIAVVLSPVIYLLVKKIPLLFLLALACCWVTDIRVFEFSLRAFLFFSIGSAIGIHGKTLFDLDRFGKPFLVLYFAVLSLVTAFPNDYSAYLRNITTVLGIPGAIYLTKFLVAHPRSADVMAKLSVASFFVFAVHTPLLSLFRKVAYSVIPYHTTFTAISLYVLVPVIVAVTAYILYLVMNKVMPKFTSLLTGGR